MHARDEILYEVEHSSIADFEDAVKIIMRRRNVPPAIYNIGRLYEAPIPILNQSPDRSDGQNDQVDNPNQNDLI